MFIHKYNYIKTAQRTWSAILRGKSVIAKEVVECDLGLDNSRMFVRPYAVCCDECQMTGVSGSGLAYEGGNLVAKRQCFLGVYFVFTGCELHFANVGHAVRAFNNQVNLRALAVSGRFATPFLPWHNLLQYIQIIPYFT